MNLSTRIRQAASAIMAIICCGFLFSAHSAWVNATANLAGIASECGTVQNSPWAVPGQNIVVAGVSNVGLYKTTNNGASWEIMSSEVKARPKQFIVDPENPGVWWYCGIYHSPSIFKTTDNGTTWSALGNTYHHDGMAVDFSDPQRRIILAGTHEMTRHLYKSTDGGQNFTDIGSSLPSSGNSCYPYIINSQTYLVGLRTSSGGIVRSTDAGATWTSVSSIPPRTFITKGLDGSLYYTAENNSIVKGNADGTTWQALSGIQGFAAPVEILPDGAIAVAARGTTGIAISSNNGSTWRTVAGPLPSAFTGNNYSSVNASLTYNSVAGAFFLATFTCGNTVASNEIWKYDTLLGSTDIAIHRAINRSDIAMRTGISPVQYQFDITGRIVNLTRSDACRIVIAVSENGMATKCFTNAIQKDGRGAVAPKTQLGR